MIRVSVKLLQLNEPPRPSPRPPAMGEGGAIRVGVTRFGTRIEPGTWPELSPAFSMNLPLGRIHHPHREIARSWYGTSCTDLWSPGRGRARAAWIRSGQIVIIRFPASATSLALGSTCTPDRPHMYPTYTSLALGCGLPLADAAVPLAHTVHLPRGFTLDNPR